MNSKEQKIAKIKKSGKIARIIVTIAQIVVLAGIVLLVGSAITVTALKPDINSFIAVNPDNLHMNVEAQFGILKFTLLKGQELVATGEYVDAMRLAMLSGTGVLAVVSVILFFLRRLVSAIEKSDSPFSPRVMKDLKIVFIVAIVAAVLTTGVYEAAIVALVCRCLYLIFDYGNAIQTEVDETL